MTKQRYDNHSTEFGEWLRVQPEIDSSLGYIATNIDYFWEDYKSKKFMLIEEKRHLQLPKFPQINQFQRMDSMLKDKPFYHGFHIITFENHSPNDGKIYIDTVEVSVDTLFKFLRFELDDSWYITFFNKPKYTMIGYTFSIKDSKNKSLLEYKC